MILSRRDYFSIFLMMLALFFIFQFSQIMKDTGNEFEKNEYASESSLTAEDIFVPTGQSCVWVISAEDSPVADAAKQWCLYTKVRSQMFSDIPAATDGTFVKAIIIDPSSVDIRGKTDELYALAGMGSPMVFANLPDPEYVDGDEDLKKLLGITTVVQDEVHVDGIQIFDGFLLGGETIYTAHNEDEKAYEDISMDFPWYDTGLGTKTYIVGIMDEELVTPYDFPKVIWRSYYNGTFIFAVNGDYLEGMMGIGFLDSMMYDVSDYYLYPVVNSNNVVMADFPYLSNENTEGIMQIYSRDAETFQRDIVWPGIVAMSTKREFDMTCFLSTRYDYSGEASSNSNDLVFYLQQMKEVGAEAGKSLNFKGDITLEDKLESDDIFYRNSGSSYNYRSVFVENWNPELPDIVSENHPEIKTVVCGRRNQEPVISYCGDNMTLQYATNRAEDYSFRNALLYKSLMTSLAYSNVLIDMSTVIWPLSVEEEWQNYFDYVYSFMTTYWTDDMGFDNTTISQADKRVRNMLAVQYASERDVNGIRLYTKGADNSFFILRTHGEDIKTIINGDYTLIEENVYLIHSFGGETIIGLMDSEDVYRYDGPF